MSEGDARAGRADVVVVRGPRGAMSLELMHVREGVLRAFLRQSPRTFRLPLGRALELSGRLAGTGAGRVLVSDNRTRLLARSLLPLGWSASRAVSGRVRPRCMVCTTYDLPLDEELEDHRGTPPDLAGTSHMTGLRVDLGDRAAYGFYTDEGQTARVVSEESRRQGMLLGRSPEDMAEAAECLVHFLAAARKKWVVFSPDMGRFVRRFDPMTMWRMVLESPTGHDHSARPASKGDRKTLVRMFSEYYDEDLLRSSMRLRRTLSDRSFSVFVADGGFVTVRLEGEAGLVYDIYVTPTRQGEGVGGELMRCALSSLAGRASTAYLHTSYPRAKALYERFGFRTAHSQLVIRLDELAFEPPSR